jgi:hypothetical protein
MILVGFAREVVPADSIQVSMSLLKVSTLGLGLFVRVFERF